MVIVGLILLNLLILNLWLWITRTVRQQSHTQTKWWLALIIGLVAAGGLLFYPTLLHWLELAALDFTSVTHFSWSVIGALLGYLLVVLVVNSLIVARPVPTRMFGKHLFFFLLVVIGLRLFAETITFSQIALYYLLVAGSEELLKYLSGRKLQEKIGYASQDIILLCLLVALGFAFFENIIYLIELVATQLERRQQLTQGGTILITRGLMGSLVHLLFSGLIATAALFAFQRNNLLWLIGGICLSIGFHLTYNYFLAQHVGIIVLFYLLAGYGFLSRLFYQSDRLYLTP